MLGGGTGRKHREDETGGARPRLHNRGPAGGPAERACRSDWDSGSRNLRDIAKLIRPSRSDQIKHCWKQSLCEAKPFPGMGVQRHHHTANGIPKGRERG